jgi:hypothetical protein
MVFERIRASFGSMNLEKLGIHFSILTFVLWLVAILIQNDLPGWANDKFVFVLFITSGVFYFSQLIKKIPEIKRDKSSIVYYFSHLFLLSLLVIAANQFLKRVWIIDNLFYISVLSIGFGFLTFYANRDGVYKEIEEEKTGEKKRAEKFGDIHSRMNSIPVLRYLFRWMYTVGWKFSIPFVVLIAIFIIIKIGMSLIYTGSYLDEYLHIFSGIQFFKTGHFTGIYGDSYTRGAYVSFFAGLFVSLFGKTIFVVKMIPAIVGIVNFFLLYSVAKLIIKRSNYVLFLMLIYTLSPLVIFSHFYIRMFVFYEFFGLIIIYLLIKFKKYFEENKSKKFILTISCLSLLVLLFFISSEIETIIFLPVIAITISYIFCFELKNSKKSGWIGVVKRIPIFYKILILILILILGYIVFNAGELLHLFFKGGVTHGAGSVLKYYSFFMRDKIILTVLFILGGVSSFFSKEKFIGFMPLMLFLIHMTISPQYRVIRGILYFIPIFLLFIIYILSRLNFPDTIKKMIPIFIIFLVVFNNPVVINGGGPSISGEVAYIEFGESYNYVNENCVNSTNYGLIHSPYISSFYDMNFDYIFYIREDLISLDKMYYSRNDKDYFLIYDDTPVIIDSKKFQKILNDNNSICLVIASDMRHNRQYIEEATFNNLDRFLDLKESGWISIYSR